MSFTHLHVHTEFSLLDGSNKIKEYVSRVKELNMDSAAITDHGVMYGVIDFYKECKAKDIKPIIGCEVYVAPDSRFNKENVKGQRKYNHLVLLAENNEGYSNLMKIVSKGFTEGYYYKPRVDKDLLRQHHKGIIALSACLAGAVSVELINDNYEKAKEVALEYQDIFGRGNYFLELQDHGIVLQKKVNQQMLQLSKETEIPLVVTNDIHYTYAEDAVPHDVLLCLQTGKKLQDQDRMRYEGGQYYVKSEEQMKGLFPYALEAIENTQKIADRCNVEIEFGKLKLPKFDVPKPYTSEEYLEKLCMNGLKDNYKEVKEEHLDRLNYELSVIKKMGYVDYFLIVWDFIKYARDHGIMVGPGRGSAAGSIVSYTLGITQLDPLKYNLLFERFLNPERVSMPDIDIDFCFERRQEVIDYVVRKYGKEQVVQIVTFGTLAARGVIRDVGRVLDLPYALCDQIAKMIPKELDITIDKAIDKNPELKEIYENNPEVKNLIDLARRLEGLPRHTSMHAAGVVISQKAVDEYVPLSVGQDGCVTTQYIMTTLEELGLLKMDFLGLRTLTVIQKAITLIKENRGIDVDLKAIDYDDKNVYASLSTGNNDGVFQLESSGMKSFMKELKPENLEDIIAGISLYRPGPMDFIPQYIKGKNNKDSIFYDTKELEPILKSTYGCIVYQEQVMEIVRSLAGYTYGRSDLLRRAMSKKKAEVMVKERQNFVYGNEKEGVKGAVKNGISEEVANKIYDEMVDFAKYAFNKSHAAAYGIVSYETAYLKHYYPVEFMAALMTSVIDNPTKVTEYIYVCDKMGINILPPDINTGMWGFSIDNDNIRYGLSAIKGIGKGVIDQIVKERDENGKFLDLMDFIKRLGSVVNKRAIESFIKAGALDSLNGNRHQKILAYERIVEHYSNKRKNDIQGQISLFDIASGDEKESYNFNFENVEEFNKKLLLAFEKEVLGVYISGHPLDEYSEIIKNNSNGKTIDFLYVDNPNEKKIYNGERIVIGAMIISSNIRYTKNNKQMAILTIEDLYGTMEVICFPKVYEKFKDLIKDEAKLFFIGRVNEEEERDSKLFVETVIPMDNIPLELWLQFKDKDEFEKKISSVKEVLWENSGNATTKVYLKKEQAMKVLDKDYYCNCSGESIVSLKEILGEENVKIVQKSLKSYL